MKILTENETMIPLQVLCVVEKNNLQILLLPDRERQTDKKIKMLVVSGPKA